MPVLDEAEKSCMQYGLTANFEIKASAGRETLAGQIAAREAMRRWKAP